MIHPLSVTRIFCSFVGIFFSYSTILLASPITLEIATILPDGTGGSTALRTMGKSIAAETKGDINLKFLWGGMAGSDADVLSQINAGTIKGAMFAGQIMDGIAPIMREGEIPFQFGNDRSKARAFVAKNSATWAKGIAKSGFHSLGFYEVGFVYLCSKKPVKTLSDLSGAKIWVWPGDVLGRTVINEFKGVPTEIAVQDSYKAFADGRLEMAYGPAIAIIALQWYTKAPQVVIDPISYATGSLLLSDKVWKNISGPNQAIIEKFASEAIVKLNEAAVQDEGESLEALKSLKVAMTKLPDADKSKLATVNKAVRSHWKPKH
jgi:TRAP-type C4-dicarboxylate transport system substrate-binding protein